MIRFIWQNWWRRKERFILLLIGALIVSLGLTYLIGVSESNKGTIVDHLEQRWSASYDIVVRPADSRSITEDKQLLEPNYLSGLQGGISIEQYEKIKKIPGVEVAAPIAMIGYAGYDIEFQEVEFEEEGIYRQTFEEILDNGLEEKKESWNHYSAEGNWNILHHLSTNGSRISPPVEQLEIYSYSLLAGIDPVEEAKLVGLDEAIIPLGDSRYFDEQDKVVFAEDSFDDNLSATGFPVIVSNQSFVDKSYRYTFERLDMPFNQNNVEDMLEQIKDNGGLSYLDTIEVTDDKYEYSFSEEDAFRLFVNSVSGVDMDTGEPFEENHISQRSFGTWIVFRPSPLQYREVKSPFPDRWPFAYQVESFQNDPETKPGIVGIESFREPITFGSGSSSEWPRIMPNWIGFYDPGKLDIAIDPSTELPMETYRPASAELVIDANDEPLNPAKTLKPTNNPYDFLTNPPSMLTTIEAAEEILGDRPISSIRIKVAGVADLSEESQGILEKVASEIEKETGLITDITLGSSPQLTLTHIPSINNEQSIGWLQQPWVNIGSSMSIFREAKIGFTAVIFSVIAVAIVYVWATGLVSMLARRKEFAVLLSIGWRPSQLSKMLFYESIILGTFVALLSWTMLSFVYVSTGGSIGLTRFILTGLFGFIVYVMGAIIPSLLTRRISPYEAIRTGEISKSSSQFLRTRGLFSMAFNHFIGKWKRTILSVLSIALPTGLLALFLYISLRLRGIMYTTWLGQYVALEVGPVQYAAIVVALIIAILTTAEIMWQNITERQEEIALLKAVGWRNHIVRILILLEGFLSGVIAALIGISLALAMLWGLYGEFPSKDILFILATGIIPIIIGVLGAIVPAEKAVRIQPVEGMGGSYSNRKISEKRLKWVFVAGASLLVGIFTFSMVQIAPTIKETEQLRKMEEMASNPTEGLTEVEDSGTKEIIEELEEDEEDLEEEEEYIRYGGNVTHLGEEFFLEGNFRLRLEAGEATITEFGEGMEAIVFELTYENHSDMNIDIRSRANFELYSDKGLHLYEKMTIIEEEHLEQNRILPKDGKIKMKLEYNVEKDADILEMVFRNNQIGSGLLIKME